MWVLVQEADHGEDRASLDNSAAKWALRTGSEYRIGSQNCEIQIQDNETVSRHHARLSVYNSEISAPDGRPEVLLEDLKSKYGTYLNGAILNPKTSLEEAKSGANGRQLSKPTKLRDNDRICFGLLRGPVFRLRWWSLEVTSSMLKDKSKVNSWLNTLAPGTKIQANWSESTTHLVMSSIYLSPKIVNCLASGVPIVTPEYFRDMSSAALSLQKLPEASAYVPPVADAESESQLRLPGISFSINKKRRKLFAEKTFVFMLEEQEKEVRLPIRLAGGSSVLWNSSSMEPELLARPGYVLVKPKNKAGATFSQTQSQQLSGLSSLLLYLERRGLVPIPGLEIYLAIVHCDVNRFCNPARKVGPVATSTAGGGVPGHPTPSRIRAEETPAISTAGGGVPGHPTPSRIRAEETPAISTAGGGVPGHPTPSRIRAEETPALSGGKEELNGDEQQDTQILPSTCAGKRWADGVQKKRLLSSEEEEQSTPPPKRLNNTTPQLPLTASGSRDMFASTSSASFTAHLKENLNTANTLKRPSADIAPAQPTAKLQRQVVPPALLPQNSTSLLSGKAAGSSKQIDRSQGLSRASTSRNCEEEEEDLFGFGPAQPRPVVASSRRPVTGTSLGEEEGDIFGFQTVNKSAPATQTNAFVVAKREENPSPEPIQPPCVLPTRSSAANSSITATSCSQLDTTGYIGKDSFLKRGDIKKEECDQETESLSKTLECISIVKLFRPAPPRPKYVPSDNQSLLGKPVKDFKKFQKQAVVQSSSRITVVPADSVQSRLDTWITDNAHTARRIQEQEERDQQAEEFWQFSQREHQLTASRRPAAAARAGR